MSCDCKKVQYCGDKRTHKSINWIMSWVFNFECMCHDFCYKTGFVNRFLCDFYFFCGMLLALGILVIKFVLGVIFIVPAFIVVLIFGRNAYEADNTDLMEEELAK